MKVGKLCTKARELAVHSVTRASQHDTIVACDTSYAPMELNDVCPTILDASEILWYI